MVDIYIVALCAITIMFGLMVGLTVILIRDQSFLRAKQQILEHRTDNELQSFREQIKTFKRANEQEEEESDN